MSAAWLRKYSDMFKRLALLFVIDVIVIALWAWWANAIRPTQGEAMALIFLVHALIILNAIVSFVLRARNSPWASAVLINTVMAYVILFAVFKFENWRQERDYYRKYYFTDNNATYVISLNLVKGKYQNGLDYSIYERMDENSSRGTGLGGTYTQRNDTIILVTTDGMTMKIYDKTLYDYPQTGGVKKLRNRL